MLDFRQQAAIFEKFLQQQSIQFFSKEPNSLYEPCSYMLTIGGKRIRPAVCLMAASLFQEQKTEKALWTALAIELFHNFTLIHDDIMDNAPLRRGKTTVYKKYNEPTAILSGDLMNIYAYVALQQLPPAILIKILPIFNQTAIEVCEGQQMDMDFETLSHVSKEDYIEMIRLKTAVLLAASMKMGALCARATYEDAKNIYDFGLNLGIAFQLQDDYLDSFGTSESIGKQIGGDILADKKTFLAIEAFEKANKQQKEILVQLKSKKDTEKIKDTLEIFKALKIDEHCKQAIEHYTQKAIAAFEKIDAPKDEKAAFLDLLNFLMHREH